MLRTICWWKPLRALGGYRNLSELGSWGGSWGELRLPASRKGASGIIIRDEPGDNAA